MPKDFMIEAMLADGRISLERAEELSEEHYDIVESEWLHGVDLIGAFGPSDGITSTIA